MSSDKYREYADECFDWAKTAESEKERKIFIEMARTWLAAAVFAQRRKKEQTASISQESMSLH